jgi:hypothetical protein
MLHHAPAQEDTNFMDRPALDIAKLSPSERLQLIEDRETFG